MAKINSKIGWPSATAIVVANMVGTGVFTSLGFQVVGIENTWSLLLLWLIGGVVALAGAFSYAELGSYFKRSGGEYHYLSEIYHPLVGYLSGWISLTVGFAAPIALAAMAMGAYISPYWSIDPKWMAVIVVLIVSLIHSISIRQSSRFQNTTTLLKVILIILFIVCGLWISPEETGLDFTWIGSDELGLPAFAVSLVYVTYSYTGWNAAAYIVEEIEDVETNLPKALIRGTALVTLLYLLLQFIFLRHTPIDQLAGQMEIGHIVANQMLGETGGKAISYAIAFFLISSISAMVWVGPRVGQVMAEDYRLWRFLGVKNKNAVPVKAIWFQTGLSVLLILTGSFEQVLLYCGFILQLSSALSVGGTILLRRKNKEKLPYQSPAYPFFALFFVGISIWILVFLIYEKPFESLLGLSNLLLGGFSYWIGKKIWKK